MTNTESKLIEKILPNFTEYDVNSNFNQFDQPMHFLNKEYVYILGGFPVCDGWIAGLQIWMGAVREKCSLANL